MKSIKTMLLGITTLLMTLIGLVIDGRTGSIGVASTVLLITGAVIFLVGMFMKTDK